MVGPGMLFIAIQAYENKVRHSIEQRIETMGMQDKIFAVVVPTEQEIEIKDGKRREVDRRVFRGYILVQLVMDEDSWYVVRNTPGVTGFVGMGNEPTPLRPEEVSKIMNRMEAGSADGQVQFPDWRESSYRVWSVLLTLLGRLHTLISTARKYVFWFRSSGERRRLNWTLCTLRRCNL